jgi:hypothetical protein
MLLKEPQDRVDILLLEKILRSACVRGAFQRIENQIFGG